MTGGGWDKTSLWLGPLFGGGHLCQSVCSRLACVKSLLLEFLAMADMKASSSVSRHRRSHIVITTAPFLRDAPPGDALTAMAACDSSLLSSAGERHELWPMLVTSAASILSPRQVSDKSSAATSAMEQCPRRSIQIYITQHKQRNSEENIAGIFSGTVLEPGTRSFPT